MPLTIRNKLILLIASGLIAITIIGGIGGKTAFQIFSSVESVNTYQDLTKGLADLKSVAEQSILLAMDSIVDKQEGDISAERLAQINDLSTATDEACERITSIAGEKAWLQTAQKAIRKLLHTTEFDLRNLIIDQTKTETRLNNKFNNIANRIEKRSQLLMTMTDSLTRKFADRGALSSVQAEISQLKFSTSKFSNISLKLILKKEDGVSQEAIKDFKTQLYIITSAIDALSMLAFNTEEENLCASMMQTTKALEQDGVIKLPSLLLEWTTTLRDLNVKFEQIDDTLDASGESVLHIIQKEIDNTTTRATELTMESNSIFTGAIWALIIVFSITAIILSVLGTIVIKGVTTPLGRTVNYANSIANGNLESVISYHQKDEIGELVSSIQNMVFMLKKLISEADNMKHEADEKTTMAEKALEQARVAGEQAEIAKQEGIAEAASRLASVVTHITTSANELQNIVENTSSQLGTQNSRLTETAVSMEQMHATVFDVSQNAATTSQHTQAAKEMATHGAETVHKVTEGVTTVQSNFNIMQQGLNELNQHANGIGEIMGVITDIADQTNLLALNAAIEAARAGDAGRGFAVVADEVRKLAEKTMQATHEVGSAVTSIQSGTQHTVQGMHNTTTAVSEVTNLADEAGQNLNEIVNIVQTSSEQVASIAAAAEEQSTASEEINHAVSDVSRVSQEVYESMEVARNTLDTLAQQANELQNIMTGLQNG
ncbi:methyl-accepting chemotaxis protein [Halodesulfovibrio sp. MK-HDV]|uniref:methyl-accepting chemotaxis protein n=1 Tax=Halodesulfovibrio sp. MK-HDV TaxID=2599925 RepID=UPI00136DB26C|nr:HAMP domain-containing methyl-accepting chemotaxis protein [Halodesulfovibrio sp. MK-HDV]KAF1073547.1 Methyl-accepting chemotaxis protein McpQ [Halodesulfovibrio sp. MK-HDV]